MPWLWSSAPPWLVLPGLSGPSPPPFTHGWDLGFPGWPHPADLGHPCNAHSLSGIALSPLLCCAFHIGQ